MTASARNPVTVHGPDPAAPGPRGAQLAGGAAWMPLIPALVTLAIALYQHRLATATRLWVIETGNEPTSRS